jgi:hypothetical protein
MMSMLCNCCVRELLILARTWFAFGLPSKTGCDKFLGSSNVGIPRLIAIAAKSTQGPPYTDHSPTALAPSG